MLQGKTAFITGASRGIGHCIGLALAREGVNIVIAAKTAEPHPSLPGTIYTAAKDMEQAGGKALAVVCDIREPAQIDAAVAQAVDTFGGIDIVINNASAIALTGTLSTPAKRYDLMHQVNVRGTFLVTQAALPHLLHAGGGHVLNISPPLNMSAKWFKNHCAYTMTKYGMSMCVLGMSEEFREQGIAVNALWPRTAIATAAINMLGGEAMMRHSRKPEIMADAAVAILRREPKAATGMIFIDEDVLRAEGKRDFNDYAVDPMVEPMTDFFLDQV